MRVAITGATGFIGRALCERLHSDYEVVGLSRSVERGNRVIGHMARVVRWDGRTAGGWAHEVDGAVAVVNLAGENVASGRWSRDRKNRILQSRVDAAWAVLRAVEQAAEKPQVVLLGSAVGAYGSRGDEQLDEGSDSGQGFLAGVCRAVEDFAGKFDEMGVRCVLLRTGVVLGKGGGALEKMAIPFRLHFGGYIGTGEQWLSWVSLRDEVSAIRFLMESEKLRGPFNLTGPEPVRMKVFSKALGAALGRRSWTAMPAFAARLAFGQMADEMLLASQRALPKRLLEAGFEFEHPKVEQVLAEIFGERRQHESE